MKCSLQGCEGPYEHKLIVHTLLINGEVIVIDQVPAEVCTLCGDTLFAPETVRHIENIISTRGQPVRTVPLYEYA